jgi:hypothetical protein
LHRASNYRFVHGKKAAIDNENIRAFAKRKCKKNALQTKETAGN